MSVDPALLARAREPGRLPSEQRALDDLVAQYLPEDSKTWTRCWEYPCGSCDNCLYAQAAYGVDEHVRMRFRRAQLGLLWAVQFRFDRPGYPLPFCSTWERMLKT